MMSICSEKHIWTREEDLKLLKLIKEHAFAWKKIAIYMNVRSKYSLMRRYKKILRKYQKKFVPNLREFSEETKNITELIIANLEGDSVFFCPLFYKPSSRKIKHFKASHCSSSTAASSPRSSQGKVHAKKEPISTAHKQTENITEEGSGETGPCKIENEFLQEDISLFDFSSLKANQSLSYVFSTEEEFLKNTQQYDGGYSHFSHYNNDLPHTENSIGLKSNLMNRFENLHQEVKQAFKPGSYVETTPAKHSWPAFDVEQLHSSHLKHPNLTRNPAIEYTPDFFCEADEMVLKWYDDEY